MNKTSFLDKIKLGVSRAGFKIQQRSPEILIIGGVLGMVGGAVYACVATRKLDDVLDDAEADIEDVNEDEKAEILTAEEASSERRKVQVKAGVEIAKLYSPAVGLGALSITCIFASNGILRKRSAAIAAAYTAVDQAFHQYRSNVVDKYGKDVDYELRYGLSKEKVQEEIVDEKGKTKTIEKEINVIDNTRWPDGYSDYARIFDASNPNWEKSTDYTKHWLILQERYENQKLRSEGHRFLNQVYEDLGFRDTESGQHVGWIFDEKNPTGDNYISFNIFDLAKEKNRDYINGYEDVIILDFNVDGDIINPLMKRELMGKV